MKLLNIFLGALLCIAIVSCKNNDSAAKKAARDSLNVTESTAPAPVATPAASDAAEPPQNAAGIWHYTCANGCAGGAGAAGPCPTCGGELKHNSDYHNNTGAASTPGATPAITPVVAGGATSTGITPPPAPKAPEPPQNAKGVWHYTCSAGCDGGAGAAGVCLSCGGPLAHNAEYHN